MLNAPATAAILSVPSVSGVSYSSGKGSFDLYERRWTYGIFDEKRSTINGGKFLTEEMMALLYIESG